MCTQSSLCEVALMYCMSIRFGLTHTPLTPIINWSISVPGQQQKCYLFGIMSLKVTSSPYLLITHVGEGCFPSGVFSLPMQQSQTPIINKLAPLSQVSAALKGVSFFCSASQNICFLSILSVSTTNKKLLWLTSQTFLSGLGVPSPNSTEWSVDVLLEQSCTVHSKAFMLTFTDGLLQQTLLQKVAILPLVPRGVALTLKDLSIGTIQGSADGLSGGYDKNVALPFFSLKVPVSQMQIALNSVKNMTLEEIPDGVRQSNLPFLCQPVSGLKIAHSLAQGMRQNISSLLRVPQLPFFNSPPGISMSLSSLPSLWQTLMLDELPSSLEETKATRSALRGMIPSKYSSYLVGVIVKSLTNNILFNYVQSIGFVLEFIPAHYQPIMTVAIHFHHPNQTNPLAIEIASLLQNIFLWRRTIKIWSVRPTTVDTRVDIWKHIPSQLNWEQYNMLRATTQTLSSHSRNTKRIQYSFVIQKKLSVFDSGYRNKSGQSGIFATIFGGTGIFGKLVGERLGNIGSNIIFPVSTEYNSLAADPIKDLKLCGPTGKSWVHPGMDFRDQKMIERMINNSNVVISMVGPRKYVKRRADFEYINIEVPERIAHACSKLGVHRLIHFSAAGADPNSPSLDFQTKYEAEAIVKKAFPNVTILRPCPVYWYNDYFTSIIERQWVCLFKKGVIVTDDCTALKQPISALDIASCVMNALKLQNTKGKTYALGGPNVLSYLEIYEILFNYLQRQPRLIYISPNILKPIAEKIYNWEFLSLDMMAKRTVNQVAVASENVGTIQDLYVEPVTFRQGIQFLFKNKIALFGQRQQDLMN